MHGAHAPHLCLVKQDMEEQIQKQVTAAVDLRDDNTRLREHIADLESRKRAPLYQKKQEEELKAAVDKAQEAETRASDAEQRAKQAKVGLASMCESTKV